MLVTIEKVLLLKQMPLFKTVSNMALSDLMSFSEEQTFKAGDVLISKDTPNQAIYFLLSGRVEKANATKKELINAKAIIGLDSVFWIAVVPEQVVVVQKAVVLKVPQDKLYRMMALHPSLATAILNGLSELIHQ